MKKDIPQAAQEPAEQTEQEHKKSAEMLMGLYTESAATLFRDQLNDAYAFFPGKEGWKVRRVDSDDFAHWLRWLYYQGTRDAIGQQALQKVVDLCACMAHYDGPEYPLYNRIALREGTIIYHLCTTANQVVIIDVNGFRVTDQSTPLFRYYRQQRPQVPPAGEGDVREVLPFINLKAGNKDMELLLLVYIISCFIPEYPHALLIVLGEKGSAKSTLLRLIRRLVDPAKPLLLGLPENIDDLPQQLDQNYYAPYDNVQKFSQKVSDRFCRAVTGDGDTRRKLYTDDDTFNREYQRCIALNGINVCAEEPDLLDRCLLLELERIPKNRRRREREFWKTFEGAIPRILHGVFQTLSKAITLYDSINPPGGHNRMADFEHWGCAIAEALGFTTEEFVAAYERNMGVQTQVAIDESDVAQAIQALMEREEGCRWEGTASELLATLTDIATEEKINTKGPSWPSRANALSKSIRSVLSNLRDVGIQVAFIRDGRNRRVTIQKVPGEPSQSIPLMEAEKNDGDGGDDDSAISIP